MTENDTKRGNVVRRGPAWYLMVSRGPAWSRVVPRGPAWYHVIPRGTTWFCLVFPVAPRGILRDISHGTRRTYAYRKLDSSK